MKQRALRFLTPVILSFGIMAVFALPNALSASDPCPWCEDCTQTVGGCSWMEFCEGSGECWYDVGNECDSCV